MLQTQVKYLARESLYQKEKPYSADFEIKQESGIQRTNFILEKRDVQVIPANGRRDFNLDIHGFCILKEYTSLTLEDALKSPEQAELSYQQDLEEILHRHFPEYERLEALDFVVRQRHGNFPSETTEVIQFEQPAAVVHADYTYDGALQQLRGSFPGQEAHFVNREFDMINVWKPLAGPNNDWPLAICDYSSIVASDIVHADVLHADRTTENQLLHYNEKHRWFYVADQETSDLLVFRNVDSTGNRAVGFHAAVPNSSSEGPPRTSIEVRFVAFR